jgi:hypothetical protein
MAWGTQEGSNTTKESRSQGMDWQGMAGPSNTLGNPWIPLEIRP